MRTLILGIITTVLFSCTATTTTQKTLLKNSPGDTETEIKDFYRSYAGELQQQNRQAIADRYDTTGYYRMGNGSKTFYSFEESKKRYLTDWNGPRSFEWKDISVEVISPEAAVVTALFEWQGNSGEKTSYSYTSLLQKKNDKWRIRVEDESFNPAGYSVKPISGSRSVAGIYHYLLTAQPGASISAHLHSSDMKIKVVSGRKFIIMGNLDTARVQRFDAGSSFVIPANTWHMEWWEEETVEDIEIMAPWKTQRAIPASPRKTD